MKWIKKFMCLKVLWLANLLLTGLGIYLGIKCYRMSENLVDFPMHQQELFALRQENNARLFPWESYKNADCEHIQKSFKTGLAQADFLQKDFEIYPADSKENRRYKQDKLTHQTSFFSGFLLYNDCLDFLKLIVQFDGPVWIHSLTLQRNHFDNYGFQISMIYTIAALK